MNKQILKNVLNDQHSIITPENIISRTIYEKVLSFKKNKQILIISGIRRCGKSTLITKLRNNSIEKDYWINFDDDRLVNFSIDDFQMLYELFVEMYGPQKTFYFDEIQNIPEWERFVRRLHDQGNKVYITGSNASLLSAELGTRLTGRNIEINLYPYSFREYLEYKNQTKLITSNLSTIQKGLLQSEFNNFLKDGGLPEYLELSQKEYLHGLYQNIIYRDIIVRHNIKNHKALKQLVYYLASNLGKECSFNSLKKVIGMSSATTIAEYCEYLQDSYLCFFINKFDYSLKKQIQSNKKVYFIDQALACTVGFRFSKDHGRLLENIVFLELKRQGYEIYFHKGKKECDFVICEQAKVSVAIQVTVSLDNEETRQREISGLVEALNEYKLTSGFIITNDSYEEIKITENNKSFLIKVIPIWSWLLDL